MITQYAVEKFIEAKPSIVREVFSSIVGKPADSSAHKLAIAGAKSFLKNYGARHSLLSPVEDRQLDFIHQLSLEEIETIANAESELEQKSVFQTLLIKPFKRFWIKLIAGYLGLDPTVMNRMNATDKDSYGAVGDGIFWAGFYLMLKP